MGNYSSTHYYCEFCGISLTATNYKQQTPHTVEDCLARLKILSKSIYDENGQKIEHLKISEHIHRLSTLVEVSAMLSEEIAEREENTELGG